MTEREKNEICKGYADLIIRKEQLIHEIWKTEFAIRNLEDMLKRNKILIPTKAEETSETDQEREALRIIKEEKQTKYYNKTPIKVETIEQYKEYVNAVKYWQTIKK